MPMQVGDAINTLDLPETQETACDVHAAAEWCS